MAPGYLKCDLIQAVTWRQGCPLEQPTGRQRQRIGNATPLAFLLLLLFLLAAQVVQAEEEHRHRKLPQKVTQSETGCSYCKHKIKQYIYYYRVIQSFHNHPKYTQDNRYIHTNIHIFFIGRIASREIICILELSERRP